MAKSSKKSLPKKADEIQEHPNATLSTLKEDPVLLYKIRVLLYDLRNVASNRFSEARTLETTDELYISAPYFTPDQAALVKAALVKKATFVPEYSTPEDSEGIEDSGTLRSPTTIDKLVPIEEAIKSRLTTFFDKRRASGDSRPCGPHDMAPIYEGVFGIDRDELQEPNFVRRVTKFGLPKPSEPAQEPRTMYKDKKRR